MNFFNISKYFDEKIKKINIAQLHINNIGFLAMSAKFAIFVTNFALK